MALADWAASDEFSALEKLCLQLADAMTMTPVVVDDELFSALSEHFDAAQLVELTGMIAWENFRARQNRALGIESDGFSEGAACAIAVPAVRPSGVSSN